MKGLPQKEMIKNYEYAWLICFFNNSCNFVFIESLQQFYFMNKLFMSFRELINSSGNVMLHELIAKVILCFLKCLKHHSEWSNTYVSLSFMN